MSCRSCGRSPAWAPPGPAADRGQAERPSRARPQDRFPPAAPSRRHRARPNSASRAGRREPATNMHDAGRAGRAGRCPPAPPATTAATLIVAWSAVAPAPRCRQSPTPQPRQTRLPATTRPALQSQYGPIVVPHEHPPTGSTVCPTCSRPPGRGWPTCPPGRSLSVLGIRRIGDRAARCSQYQVIGEAIAVDLIPGGWSGPGPAVEVVDLREAGTSAGGEDGVRGGGGEVESTGVEGASGEMDVEGDRGQRERSADRGCGQGADGLGERRQLGRRRRDGERVVGDGRTDGGRDAQRPWTVACPGAAGVRVMAAPRPAAPRPAVELARTVSRSR